MRLNIEDTAWKHIPRLAKEMGWGEREAAGALFRFWRDTQQEEIVCASRSRVASACALGFDSDEQIDRFLSALIKAQLAHENDQGYTIRGNGDHVKRLNGYRARAIAGGNAKSKKFNDFVASKQADGSHQAATLVGSSVPSYAPMLLSPFSNTNTETSILDLPKGSKPKRPKKPKASPVPSVPGVTIPVRDAWKAAYEKRYPGQRAIWGAREGGQCATLLGSFTAQELVELVPYFFAWTRPEVLKSGHSFGTGANSFAMKIHELRADIVAPERRVEAAIARKRETLADIVAEDSDAANRITELLNQGDPFDGPRAMAEKQGGSVVGIAASGTRQLAQGDQAFARVTQQTDLGSRLNGVVQGFGTIRQGEATVASAGGGVRAKDLAGNSRGQGDALDGRTGLQGTPAADTGGA